MTVVIDAPTADASQAAASALAERLRARKNLFERVDLPADSAYFQRNALLFLPPDRLQAVATRLTDAEPLLSILGGDPNLRGLSRLLNLAEQGAANGMVPDEFAGMLAQFAATTEARAEGKAATRSTGRRCWISSGGDGGTRSIVLAKPVLDDTSIERATPALDGLDEEIAKRRGGTARPDDPGHGRAGPAPAGASRHPVGRALGVEPVLRARGREPGARHPLRPADRGAAHHARDRHGLDHGPRRARGRPAQPDLRRLHGAVLRPRRRFRHPSLPPAPGGGGQGRRLRRGARPRGARRGSRRRPERALRGDRLPVLRADLLYGPRRVRHHLGLGHGGRRRRHLHGAAGADGPHAAAPAEAAPRSPSGSAPASSAAPGRSSSSPSC